MTVERADERAVERGQYLGGQPIEPAAIGVLEPTRETGALERVVTREADPDLRLPEALPLDAKPGADEVVDSEPEELLARSRWRRWMLGRAPEEQRKVRAGRSETSRGSERQIELEAAR